MSDESKYWLAFSLFPGVGPVRFQYLLDTYGSAKAAWNAPESSLRVTELGAKLIDQFLHFRRTADISAYQAQLHDLGIFTIRRDEPKYPELLLGISDAPFLLYVRGRKNGPLSLTKTIGIVGTRKMTPYGKEMAERITRDLVSYGCTIVSGLAYGIDAVAHRTAIDSGGKTIAVLGCGVDVIAPPSNTQLYEDIIDGHGAIMSEMPLGLRPNKGIFPARNRIISGVSLGVVVIEGAENSGALITARYAAEQGREVFAVPGPVTSPYSKGPALLIKQGATLVEQASDIMEALGLSTFGDKKSHQSEYFPASEAESKILSILADRRLHIDIIVRETGLQTADVSAILTVLEIHGIVSDYGEKVYGLA